MLLLPCASCGTDVAQTAVLRPVPLDCGPLGAPSLTLPSDSIFGDGSEPASRWVGDGYGAGDGPGLFVAARDAFRVYLNEELVVESVAPRQGLFVPLSLLPGDNALSVVVSAANGTPAAVVQLDDLDQSYPSDGTWKASTQPSAGFRAANYDDSDWSAATELGVLGSLPGCDPANFPDNSNAHWIGPGADAGPTVVLRKVIHVTPIGYGAATTGGFGAQPTVVDNWDDFKALATDPETPSVIVLAEGTYDFRGAPRDQMACPEACSNDATKTQYTVLTSTTTCSTALVTRTRNEQRLLLGSNKTIVGLGRGAQVRGVSFEFGTAHNVIIRNLAVFDVNPDLIEAGDAFGLTQPSQVWIDHATTKWISDGFDDVRAGAQGITLSWLHYDGVSPSECGGWHTRTADVTSATVTFHHCFFDHVESNSPIVRDGAAQVHLFANLLSDNQGIAVDALCGAQVLLEGNTFQRVVTPTERATCSDDTTPGKIDAPAGSNYYGPDVGAHRGGDGKEPHDDVFKPPYEYDVGVPQDDWQTVADRAGAGGRWRLPLSLD